MKFVFFAIILAVLKESHPLNPEILKYDGYMKDFETTGRRLKQEAKDQKTDSPILKRESPDGFNDLSLDMTSLEDIRHSNSIYVDKTRYIERILQGQGTFQLLVRPRRFGKSLLLNTIRDVLMGKKDLFMNTYIEQNHDWTTTYTVIKLESSVGHTLKSFCARFKDLEKEYGVDCSSSLKNQTDPSYFRHLLRAMCSQKKICNIALLVEECDLHLLPSDLLAYYKKFLRNLKPAVENGELKYIIWIGCTNIKDFKVNTGNPMYSLSSQNDIIDISTEDEYDTACGFTKSEIKKYYGHHIEEIMRRHGRTEEEVYNEIERWYDGYIFSGSTTEAAVYNPESIMQYLALKEFEGRSFWDAKNDRPRMVVKELLRVAIVRGHEPLNLEKRFTYKELYGVTPGSKKSAPLQRLSFESKLLHSGYLIIASHRKCTQHGQYSLRIPNIETQREFHRIIVEAMQSVPSCVNYGIEITKSFNNLDFPKLVEVFNNFSREKYGKRLWYQGIDTGKRAQRMFGGTLMISGELSPMYEVKTIKRDDGKNGSIDIYLESYEGFKAIIECKEGESTLNECMEQAENYKLPSTNMDTTLPIVRMCINFVEGIIERIVARKYNAEDEFMQEISEYVVQKEPPYKCKFPKCEASFQHKISLSSHMGHHKRNNSLLMVPVVTRPRPYYNW